ncbi:MAG TPA: ABC transporter substrate-binding protein [Acidimicrobiales bacterium]|nr:ABC transporter substrate-binding protein [Acidimicrobiales bacterium]
MAKRSVYGRACAALTLALPASLACAPADDSWPDLSGATVEVVAVWRDAEADAFDEVLDVFEARTGATVELTSTEGRDIGAVLDGRIAAGNPPDVAVLPQPGLLEDYARAGVIQPLDPAVETDVRARYSATWRRLATVDGRMYGVWFKAADKSLVWYSIGAFERAGVVPPDDLDRLDDAAAALAASGTAPFAVAAAPEAAWALTDLFENLYLRIAGPERYDALAGHRLPWTDPTVQETLAVLAGLLAPTYVAGGPEGARAMGLPEAAGAVFSPEPAAAMLVEGDFVPGVVAGDVEAELGVDVDVVPFPEPGPGGRLVVGGGDAAVLMRPRAAGAALVRFLATAEAGEAWAAQGGFLSPNEDVDLAVYPDDTTRDIARALLEAGDGFRFDLSDLQPVAFGGTTGAGMWGILRDFLVVPDVPATAARLEAAAEAAWGGR